MGHYTQRLQTALLRIWSPYDTVEQGAVRGGVLSFSGRLVMKALQFGKTIILARLLFPEDFGLFALASVALGITEILIQPSFNAALIHEKGDVKKYFNSVWTANIIRSAVLAAVIILVAPFYAQFFDAPEATNIVRVLAFILIITSFENVGVVLMQKDMLFRRKFFYDISYVLAEVLVVIIAAYYLRSPWALVIGSLGGRLAMVLFSYLLHPYRPRLELNWRDIAHLFKFGKWMWGVAILGFVMSRGDLMVIGKVLNEAELGYYQLALALALLPAIELGRVLSVVLFPFFAKIQEDISRLAQLFIGNIRLVYALIWPLTLGFVALGEEFIGLFYGDRWLPMFPIASIAIFLGVTRKKFVDVDVPIDWIYCSSIRCGEW